MPVLVAIVLLMALGTPQARHGGVVATSRRGEREGRVHRGPPEAIVIGIAAAAAAYLASKNRFPLEAFATPRSRPPTAISSSVCQRGTMMKLDALRGPREGLSDVIVGLAAAEP
jgi:hypothetical protein